MSIPAKGLRPTDAGNLIGNIGHNFEGRAYAASAVLTKDNLVIYLGGNAYEIKKKVLFDKSIRECINDIIKQYQQKAETEISSPTKEGN